MKKTLITLIVAAFLLNLCVTPVVFADSSSSDSTGIVIVVCFCVGALVAYITTLISIDAKDKEDAKIFETTLNNAIGNMTYDEAIQTWGVPLKVVEGDEYIYAEWGHSETSIYSYSKHYAALITHGDQLQLTFDKITHKLVIWKYNKN
jgi:hypothetical protein